jgi:putative copper export protein
VLDPVAISARLLLYVGSLIAIGDPAARMLSGVVRHAAHTPASRRLIAGWAAVVGALALLLHAQFAALEMPIARETLSVILGKTTWGQGWSLLVGVAVVGLAAAFARGAPRLQLLLALLLAAAMGGLGHAAADETVWLSRSLDAVHVVGAGLWIGALACLPASPSVSTWARFSRLAEVSAPLVVLSGGVSAWRRVSEASVSTIVAADYGRLLIGKIVLVLVVLALGAAHRRRVRRHDTPTSRSVRAELALAVVVLVVTAVLTGTAPPGE